MGSHNHHHHRPGGDGGGYGGGYGAGGGAVAGGVVVGVVAVGDGASGGDGDVSVGGVDGLEMVM